MIKSSNISLILPKYISLEKIMEIWKCDLNKIYEFVFKNGLNLYAYVGVVNKVKKVKICEFTSEKEYNNIIAHRPIENNFDLCECDGFVKIPNILPKGASNRSHALPYFFEHGEMMLLFIDYKSKNYFKCLSEIKKIRIIDIYILKKDKLKFDEKINKLCNN